MKPKEVNVLEWSFSFGRSFHDFDFGGSEGVTVIDQGVNLAVEAVAAIMSEFLHIFILFTISLYFFVR